MNHAEIAHRWASQYNGLYTKPKDMTLSGGGRHANVTFHGPALYSYSTVIARFREHKGKVYLLVNDTSYSNSTCKHKGHMRRAIRHLPDDLEFVIGNQRMGATLDNPPKDLYQYAIERAADCADQASRARTHKASLLLRSEEWLRDAQRISDFFGLKKKVDERAVAKLLKEREAAEKKYEADRKKSEARTKKLEAERLIVAAERLEEWLKGEPIGYHDSLLNLLPVRLRTTGEFPIQEIETSHGAVIPYRDGKLTFLFIQRLKGKGWKRNGEQFKVGPYHLDVVTEDGSIIAGCHRIHADEITRFARQEGWLAPEPPTPLTDETNEDAKE